MAKKTSYISDQIFNKCFHFYFDKYITQDDKTKNTRPKSNNDKMENKEGVKAQGIKLKYSYEKKNDYGTNHFFQVLDESPLKEIIELGKDIKMPIWEYNGKFYLKFNEQVL